MSIDRLNPEIRDAITKLPSLPFHIKPLIPFSRFLFNLAARSPVAEGISVSTVKKGKLKTVQLKWCILGAEASNS